MKSFEIFLGDKHLSFCIVVVPYYVYRHNNSSFSSTQKILSYFWQFICLQYKPFLETTNNYWAVTIPPLILLKLQTNGNNKIYRKVLAVFIDFTYSVDCVLCICPQVFLGSTSIQLYLLCQRIGPALIFQPDFI